MGQFSIWHWLIIAAVFVLFFGAKRMPDAARGLGRSLRIFKSEVSQMQSEDSNSAPAQHLPPAQPRAAAATESQPQSKSL
ncbi:Sec-independent protein translocase subunit TatA [Nocardia takedensis]|uniref:Sec-independent protein translocase subunit TatA n=1 Tax=Nocardia takedensis TaxID=259390 RepID=UPI003F777720